MPEPIRATNQSEVKWIITDNSLLIRKSNSALFQKPGIEFADAELIQ
jgi:hypothetical protein